MYNLLELISLSSSLTESKSKFGKCKEYSFPFSQLSHPFPLSSGWAFVQFLLLLSVRKVIKEICGNQSVLSALYQSSEAIHTQDL